MRPTNALQWGRVVHFYGRANEVPSLVQALGTDQHRRAERRLEEVLEHQDKITQATAPALFLILRALREDAVKDRAAVEAIIDRVREAARFQIDEQKRPRDELQPDWSLYDEGHLLPPSSSETEDEILLEEWSSSLEEKEVLGWAVLVDEIIREHLGSDA